MTARRASAAAAALVLALLAAAPTPAGRGQEGAEAPVTGTPANRCLDCHAGIEPMHPEAALSCVDCHGGDPTATKKLAAHVAPPRGLPTDERVAPEDRDLAWRRFRNPMDLRVVDRTCGQCHADACDDLLVSLHGTTAGHLSDGYFEMGLLAKRESPYGVFAVPPHRVQGGDRDSLVQVPPFMDHLPADRLSTHFSDLARKECMQCHLWSEGRAVRGRVGFDGDYRGGGCAACHVEYSVDGLSESADRTAPRNEPGHPRVHAMTAAPTTAACTTCHYGDASIGLNFRGLSQLPPGAPGGPAIPGTTDRLLNRQFYLSDPSMTPPDVHHERGMHCIDCHTQGDVMGDGLLHEKMEDAVEISCQACHGTFTAPSDLRTERGTRLEHLVREGDEVWLVSKVTGARHRVPQAVHVLDPSRPEYNPVAAEAMTPEHAGVQCYTCHSGWNPNFLGFHFDRNESLTQLDLLSGRRTPGRVTTQEKVFATWKSFYAGLDGDGHVAPYLTGFSTMGTVRGRDGELIVDQALPVSGEGLSGLTMIHHQLHTVRPTARSCVECHRSSATWGLGSTNFHLARRLGFVADRRGIEVVALDRANLAASTALAKLVLPDVVDLELETDPLQGEARVLYATEGYRGVHVIDVRDPTAPRRLAFHATVNPRGMHLAGRHLYVADGVGGLRVLDVSDPAEPRQVGHVPTFDAHEVVVQWPFAYVADGPGGLAVVDVREPSAPRVVGGLRVAIDPGRADAAVDVAVLFQYSRPLADPDDPERTSDRRTAARMLCAVLDENEGLALVDATEPSRPYVLSPRPRRDSTTTRRRAGERWLALELRSHVDLAEDQGGSRTRERDYAYLLRERDNRIVDPYADLFVVDVEDPLRPRNVATLRTGQSCESLTLASIYNPPFLQTVAFTPNQDGVASADVTVSAEPTQLGAVEALRNGYLIAVEEFPLDRMLDEDGTPLKDVSHPGSRWLRLDEIRRLLDVPGHVLGTADPGSDPPAAPGAAARLVLLAHDADGNGVLEGDEIRAAGVGVADADGDGRVTLGDLAALAGVAPSEAAVDDGSAVFLTTRVDADGDLSRLLDGVDPFAYDRDGDGRLSRDDVRKVFFAALDLDGDGRLSRGELSRYPGATRELRWGGEPAERLFREHDTNRSGSLDLREFRVAEDEWRVLDVDGDGWLQLPPDPDPWLARRGFVPPRSEWPTRRAEVSGLPPGITAERLLAVFDRNRNGELTQRELKRRPDLFLELDRDGDGVVTREEIDRRVDLVARRGVEVTADGFVARWDLDGDGRVRGEELPPEVALRVLRGR